MNLILLISSLLSLTPNSERIFWTQYYLYKGLINSTPTFIVNFRDTVKNLDNIYCKDIELEKLLKEKNAITAQLVVRSSRKDTFWRKIPYIWWEQVRNTGLVNRKLNNYLQGQFQNLRERYDLTFYEKPRVWTKRKTIYFEFRITSPTKYRQKNDWQRHLKQQLRGIFSNSNYYRFKNLQVRLNKGNVVQLEQLRDIWLVRGKVRIFHRRTRYKRSMSVKEHNEYLPLIEIKDPSLHWLDSLIVHNWKKFANVRLYIFKNDRIPFVSYQKNIGIVPIKFKNYPEKDRLFLIFYFDIKNCDLY